MTIELTVQHVSGILSNFYLCIKERQRAVHRQASEYVKQDLAALRNHKGPLSVEEGNRRARIEEMESWQRLD